MPADESPKPTDPRPEPLFEESGDASPNAQTRLTDSTAAQASSNRSATHRSPQAWIGRSVARYQIVELLGMGAMGVVYRAFDTLIERDVAIKILPAELAADEATRNRFLAEAKAAGRLANPHVVALHEVGQQDGTDYIVMELMDGGNLAQVLQRSGGFAPAEATRILADACRGLAAAHAAGMIHRDIKPSNLLLNSEGAVKLADFGLAKRSLATGQNLTLTGQVVGTPYYMSPEQCQSKTLDPRTDIYSLGATYYSLLTGFTPYHEIESTVQVMFAHVHGEPLDPRKINPAIPELCSAIVSRSTAKNPDDRYPTALDMHADLAAAHVALGGGPLISHHSATRSASGSAGQSLARPRLLRGLKLVGALVAASVIVAAAWVAWSGRGHRGADSGESSKASAPAVTGPLAQGVTDSTISFGMSTAYSGTNRDSGMNIALGFRTLFDAVNDSGGVNGRQLKLTVLDDGYEPERALANMRDLFVKRKVFAVAGNLGTSTGEVTVPYAIEYRLLFFAPITGAAFARRDPPERYVFNYRASGSEETSALVHYFVKVRHIPANSIAVFAQEDGFGEDGFQGAARAMRVYGVRAEDIFRAGYGRNSLQTADAVDKMVQRRSKIQAIVMVSTYAAGAQFVKGLHDHKMNVTLGAVSFAGSNSLAMLLKAMGPEYGEGMVVTQVVPHPKSGATGVIRYRELLHKFHPEAEPGFLSLEGFIAAECLVEGLKRTGPEVTTEKLIDALESIRDLDLGIGPIISFGPSRHQASNKVWGTVLDRDRNFQNLDLE
ncbi:MAG TPA: ABC transporter substrate-binding protein [Planctomycetaceae bacterium]|nr:ABC transporter substrate-binding protein [Planctomycetaceae bacterium]